MADPQPPDARRGLPPGAELIALDPVSRADPYPVLACLRAREPVHYDRVIGRSTSRSSGRAYPGFRGLAKLWVRVD